MPTINIPITTYSTRSAKSSHPYGSPANMPLKANTARMLMRVPVDRIPLDAVITEATLKIYANRTVGGNASLTVREIMTSWKASVTWARQPTYGAAAIDTAEKTGGVSAGEEIAFDILSWLVQRKRPGLMVEGPGGVAVGVYGSSAPSLKPVVTVSYYVPARTPSNMAPDGGSVSVAKPILTYSGDSDMTEQRIEYSIDGTTISYTTGWIPATVGRFVPTAASPALTNGGAGIYWRATTRGANGTSEVGPWAFYEYDALPSANIDWPVNGSSSFDGSPPLSWTAPAQTSWRATLHGNGVLVAESPLNVSTDKTWDAPNAVAVPNVVGKFTLYVRDGVNRVAAEGAPVERVVTTSFTTSLADRWVTVTNGQAVFDEPVVTITGETVVTPGEIGLYRDGDMIPLWDDDEKMYPQWAPASAFLQDGQITIKDYTAPMRGDHVYSIAMQGGGLGAGSLSGPIRVNTFSPSVWLIDPRTGESLEVLGDGGVPVVSQEVVEASILHTPVNTGLKTEPKRRRLTRTTRYGAVEGLVENKDEETLLKWMTDNSGLHYRLAFGRVNWSVIYGDYSPREIYYKDDCEPDTVMFSLNWWERLEP